MPILVFLFNLPPTTEVYLLSLHDALPICVRASPPACLRDVCVRAAASTKERTDGSRFERQGGAGHRRQQRYRQGDRKSTRLNSSHITISYAVFCLKKKQLDGESRDQTVAA